MARTQPRYKQLLSRNAVLRAVAEYDRRGEDEFLRRYGFGEADTYVMRWNGRTYASKAIMGVAHGYQYPDVGPLRSDNFSGGKNAAALHLSRLGFQVHGITPDPRDWTLAEVEAAVEGYFRLFELQATDAYIRRRDFGEVRRQLPKRNESAVSRKFSNISAILSEADLPILRGFGPLGNKQTLLAAVLYDWLEAHGTVFDGVGQARETGLVDVVTLEVAPPEPPSVAKAQRERKAARVDFAGRDERNRRLGSAGEQWAVGVLKAELVAGGRGDLAERVVWVSAHEGDGLGYDIAAFDLSGTPLAIEVKTTNGSLAAPFVVTANEVRASEEEPNFVLMRVFGFSENPRFYRLRGSLKRSCELTPLVFGARPAAK